MYMGNRTVKGSVTPFFFLLLIVKNKIDINSDVGTM